MAETEATEVSHGGTPTDVLTSLLDELLIWPTAAHPVRCGPVGTHASPVAEANNEGGRDNITAIVARFTAST